MRRISIVLTMLLVLLVGPVLAEYSVAERGEWPKSWPKQLEPLRKQSTTFVGPMVEFQWYAMHFTDRAQFEAAWPHILKVKSKDAPIYLVAAPYFFLGEHCKAGVVLRCPPRLHPGSPSEQPGYDTDIRLLVDGDIVDLKRITIPKGIKIIDQRVKAAEPQQ